MTTQGQQGTSGDGGAGAGAGAGAGNGGAGAGGGGTGAGEAPWYGDSPHKELINGKGFKSLDDVITWGSNAEKLIGLDRAGRTVVLPKDANDVEGMKAFRAKLGVPDKVEGYELPIPEGQDPALSKAAAQWFLDAGVPAAAARQITENWNKHIEAMVTADVERARVASNVELEKLKGEWGPEFDKRSEFARRFLQAAGWDKAKVDLYEQTFGTATMLKDFHAWGSKVAEHGFEGGQGGGGFTPQKAALQAEINTLRQKRLDNQINEKEFHAEMQRLGPLVEAAA